MYADKSYSMPEMIERFGLSASTIHNFAREHGLPQRNSGGGKK